jgi:hypothetical protein
LTNWFKGPWTEITGDKLEHEVNNRSSTFGVEKDKITKIYLFFIPAIFFSTNTSAAANGDVELDF